MTVFPVEGASGAISKIMRHPEIALVFTSISLPGRMDGRDLVLWLKLNHPHVAVMIATHGLARMERMKGLQVACAFLKPYKPEMVSDSILRVLEQRGH